MSLFKSFCRKHIGKTSVKIWRCWKCQDVRHPSLDALEVAICGFVIISLQTHPAKLASSWCKAPTLWCKIFFSFCKKLKHLLLSLVLPILTFSILLLCKCEDDFHLEYHASNQHKDSLKFVVEKHFDHHRRCISSQTLTVYQSPVLYTWTMLHDHLVDFSPIHVCWCLHFSGLLAGILSSSKTLKPLQLVHHSMPTSSLLGHLSASECLPVIGAKVIGLLFSPLGSQSHSKWKGSQSTSTASAAAGPVAVSATLLNTTFSGILPGSSSSALGSRYLDISPEWQ